MVTSQKVPGRRVVEDEDAGENEEADEDEEADENEEAGENEEADKTDAERSETFAALLI